MNRQMKRMQEKAERQSKGAPGQQPARQSGTPEAGARRAQAQQKKERTSTKQFVKEVRLELKKVDWPGREQLVSYTIVVLVTVAVLTAFTFALDFGFQKTILKLLEG